MTNKSSNQSKDGIYNYIKEVEAAKKQARAKPGKEVDALRADKLPGSQVTPGVVSSRSKTIAKRVLVLFLAIIFLGLVWYVIAGPGNWLLEVKLEALTRNEIEATKQGSVALVSMPQTPLEPNQTLSATASLSSSSIPTHTQDQAILYTQTPSGSISTVRSTPTYTQGVTATVIPSNTPSVTATLTPDCYDVSVISLADVGKTLCVQGIIKETISHTGDFMVLFSDESRSFYWVTYDLIWSKGEVGQCYRITGKIQRLISSPVLVFNYSNLPKECP